MSVFGVRDVDDANIACGMRNNLNEPGGPGSAFTRRTEPSRIADRAPGEARAGRYFAAQKNAALHTSMAAGLASCGFSGP
jgi:hypothetical protein